MLKTLASHIREFKLPSLLTPVMMVAEVIMEMVIPLLMASIIDNGVEKGDMQHIMKTGMVMVVAAGFGLLFGILGGVFAAKASTGFARNLRKAMFDHIQTFSFANIDRFSTAGLITRLTTDVTNIQMAYQMLLRMFVRAPITLIVAMCMAFYINRSLARIYLIAVLILAVFLGLIIMNVTKHFREVFKKYDDLNASVQENVSAIRVVKAYVREEYEKSKFFKASENVYKLFIRAEKILTLNMPIMMTTVYSCILLISWLGAKMIVGSELTTGELMSLLAYCMNILMSLMMLSMVFVMITMSYASGQRIAEVLNEESSLVNPENPVYQIPDGRIEFSHVNFRYNQDSDNNVLKDISLQIASGETIGIIGATGSGKTTMCHLIPRFYDVSGGRILLDGRDIRTITQESLRKNIGMIQQDVFLFAGTVMENIRYGRPDATDEEVVQAAKQARIHEEILKMPDHYRTWVGERGVVLSGGQKQRISIARVFLKNPPVLILDEATSALDSVTEAEIQKSLDQLSKDKTCIVIAHRLSTVRNADRIAVVEDMHIAEQGTRDELIAKNGAYAALEKAQGFA